MKFRCLEHIFRTHFKPIWGTFGTFYRSKVLLFQCIMVMTCNLYGDCKPVGEGISEMRIHTGKGYRVYFMQEGDCVYILLAGGDKSTQQRDIAKAVEMANERKGKR